MSGRRMLLVHAHPDDETITTGGTIARYVRAGVDVTVLTCTLGEEGEVIGDRWAELAVDRADQLGGYRIMELTTALGALGIAAPRFLGSAGRWRDSGMVGTSAATNPRAFANAARESAVAELVSVIRECRPHVVISYDPNGGYGHPDHVQAHRITTAAVDAADGDEYPDAGPPWRPAKFYWTVADRGLLERAVAAMSGVPTRWRMPDPGELPAVDPQTVTATLDITDVLDAKRAALRAHATQVEVSEDGTMYALSNAIAQPIVPSESYTLIRGSAGPIGADGREADLFAGLAE